MTAKNKGKKTPSKLPKKPLRNPYALPAKKRKGGPHKNKADKRSKENKSSKRFLDEKYQ